MTWNWQQTDWPNFTYTASALEPLEKQFLLNSGTFLGAFRHIGIDDRKLLKIELISDEALDTSKIEGAILNRDSLRSSLCNQFGLGADGRHVPPAERGIAGMMVDLDRTFAAPLTHEMLFGWHRMIMAGDQRVRTIGGYRDHAEPIHVVSGGIGQERMHFEAPPSERVGKEMDGFIAWFNGSATGSSSSLTGLTRAGIAHLYFESIHPFEDGNGRIGRALSEKALAQTVGQPSLIALAYTIERARKSYYDMLERSSAHNAITPWLVYFAETILEAQRNTLRRVDFYIAKTTFFERLKGQLNDRQENALARMLREGIDGFKGGLSAENYIAITKASRATATRDLQDLVAKGALTRTGDRRHARYHLKLRNEDGQSI